MKKEDVLQKVNDYCNEKSYTEETLTSEFKDKFSEFFAKKYDEGTTIDAEGVLDDIKFNINTAFSATSKGLTSKQKAFEAKENEYKKQIAELNSKLGTPTPPISPTPTTLQIPKEVQDKLDRLEKFENEARRNDKFKEVLSLAKKSVRADLHKSLESYAADFVVTLDAPSEEQAKKLTVRFQDIFKDTIGDTKPLAPKQTQERDEKFLESIPKVKI